MNVLIANAYSARNRGDGVIVSQMVRLFEDRGCTVRVMSDDPQDAARYDVPTFAPVIPIFPEPGATFARRRLAAALWAWVRPPQHPAFDWADACISAGGGYFYDDGSAGARLNLLLRLLTLRAARRQGLPVVLFSQSIGPWRSRAAAVLVSRELRRTDLVIVREAISLAVCRELGLKNCELCDDCAFTLEPGRAPAGVIDGPAVGVTVMNQLPGVIGAGQARYRAALAQGIIEALEDRDEEVLVISQVAAHAGDDDRPACRTLATELSAAGVRARFLDVVDMADQELCAVYGSLRLVVASRLHSAIMALSAGTPAVAIAYLPKTHGIFQRMGLGDMSLSASSLNATALARAIGDALQRHDELANALRARLPSVRASAAHGADLAIAAIRDPAFAQ